MCKRDRLWPVPPTNILEFWNYIAYAFNKRRLPYPEFMESITDLEKVQRKGLPMLSSSNHGKRP